MAKGPSVPRERVATPFGIPPGPPPKRPLPATPRRGGYGPPLHPPPNRPLPAIPKASSSRPRARQVAGYVAVGSSSHRVQRVNTPGNAMQSVEAIVDSVPRGTPVHPVVEDVTFYSGHAYGPAGERDPLRNLSGGGRYSSRTSVTSDITAPRQSIASFANIVKHYN